MVIVVSGIIKDGHKKLFMVVFKDGYWLWLSF